jgi:hypothetical protein
MDVEVGQKVEVKLLKMGQFVGYVAEQDNDSHQS